MDHLASRVSSQPPTDCAEEMPFDEIRGGFKLIRKIGRGSFGEVYLGVNVHTNEEVAVKLECLKTRHETLHMEGELYSLMSGTIGIPDVKWCGREGHYNVMVMERLGPSLEDLFNFCQRKFSLKTILLLADQMITRIESVHEMGYIHRDIKPENFLMGRGMRSGTVYMIDFGLAKKYRISPTQHIPCRGGKRFTGTPYYSSVNAHQGIELSRRDDIESLGYVLIYLLSGALPWNEVEASNIQQTLEKIAEMKNSISIERLCASFPDAFAAVFRHSRGLKFRETPNYNYLRQLFRDLLQKEGFRYDNVFDWNVTEAHQTQTLPAAAMTY